MRLQNDFVTRLAFVFLVPLAAVGATSCTLGGLDSLGAGARDAGSDTGAIVTGPDADVDTSIDDFDASADTMAPDATLDDDGGDDATVDAAAEADVTPGPANALGVYLDAQTASFCDMHQALYLFCDDFDHKPLPSKFSGADGPYLYSTSSDPSTVPDDLLLWVPAMGSGPSWGSKLSQPFTTPAQTATMEFDFNPSSTNGAGSGLLFAAVDFTANAAAKYSVRMAYNQGAPRLEESTIGTGIADLFHSNISIANDTWSHIQVTLTFVTPDAGSDAGPLTGVETIAINGTQVQQETLTTNPNFDQRPTLLIGAVFGTSPTTGWVFRYDNVTFNMN